MKNTIKVAYIALALVLAFVIAACSGSGGGKIVNSAEELKAYLDSQPTNSPDKPIKVAMNTNDLVFWKIRAAIMSAGKYVSLDLSGSPITTIPDDAFYDEDTEKGCSGLINMILPKNVTSIGAFAFFLCTGLKSITIPDNVDSIGDLAFYGCTSLTAINVANKNTEYSSQAGVLYNEDKTTLIAYPGGKTGSFTIPDKRKMTHFTQLQS